MPNPFSRAGSITLASAISASLACMGNAHVGAATGNATTWTQLLNNAELIALTGQSAEQIQNQIRSYENMLQNTLQLPAHVWGQVQADHALTLKPDHLIGAGHANSTQGMLTIGCAAQPQRK